MVFSTFVMTPLKSTSRDWEGVPLLVKFVCVEECTGQSVYTSLTV